MRVFVVLRLRVAIFWGFVIIGWSEQVVKEEVVVKYPLGKRVVVAGSDRERDLLGAARRFSIKRAGRYSGAEDPEGMLELADTVFERHLPLIQEVLETGLWPRSSPRRLY